MKKLLIPIALIFVITTLSFAQVKPSALMNTGGLRFEGIEEFTVRSDFLYGSFSFGVFDHGTKGGLYIVTERRKNIGFGIYYEPFERIGVQVGSYVYNNGSFKFNYRSDFLTLSFRIF